MVKELPTRAFRGAGAVLLCVGLAASLLVVNFVLDDADAARKKKPLKSLWAVVRINGDHSITVTRSKGVEDSTKLGVGIYKIGFNRNVSGCAAAATIDQGHFGFISVQVGPVHSVSTEREVVVSAYDHTITHVERPFHLILHC